MQLRELPYIKDTVQFNLAQILLLLPANHYLAVTIYSLELRCDISGFDITKKATCCSRPLNPSLFAHRSASEPLP